MATEAEILRCHSNELLELIKASESMTEDQLKELSTSYDAIYMHPVWYVLLVFFCVLDTVCDEWNYVAIDLWTFTARLLCVNVCQVVNGVSYFCI